MIAWLTGSAGRYLLGGLAIVAALGYLYYRGYQTGVAHEREVREHMIMLAQITATNVTNDLQRRADNAYQARDKASSDLDAYRHLHPVHVSLCHTPSASSSLPAPAGAEPAGAAAGDVVQQAPAIDIGAELDHWGAAADTMNEQYRSCKTAYADAIKALQAP